MNAKLRSIPAIAADVFLFWGIVYATATANEAEALPLLALFGAALVFETRLADDIARLRDMLAGWGIATQTVLWVGLATSMIYVVSGIAQYVMGRRVIDRYPLKASYVVASALQIGAMGALAMGNGYLALAGAIASAVLSSVSGPVENILIATQTITNSLISGGQTLISFATDLTVGVVTTTFQGYYLTATTLFQVTQTVFNATGQALAWTGEEVGNLATTIGDTYRYMANQAPGVVRLVLTGMGDGIAWVVRPNLNMIRNTWVVINSSANYLATTAQGALDWSRESISTVAFVVGEKMQDVSDTAGFAIVKVGYLFVNEPTIITDVRVEALSATSAKISWLTNHPANGKVNYGLDRTYPYDQQSEKRVTDHEFVLTDLQPDTLYYFEVMSHNNNYVYDANREFRTLAK